MKALYVKLVENAVSIPDNSTGKLCEAAKNAGFSVVIGLHGRKTETSGTSLYISLLFNNDQGEITGKYRKLIPTGGERLIWAQGFSMKSNQ